MLLIHHSVISNEKLSTICFLLLTEWIDGFGAYFWCLMPFACHLVTCPNMRTKQPDLKMLEIIKLNLVFRRTQLTFYQENCIVSALPPRFVWLCLEVICQICEFVVLPRVLWKHMAHSHSVPQNDTTKNLRSIFSYAYIQQCSSSRSKQELPKRRETPHWLRVSLPVSRANSHKRDWNFQR